MSEPSEDPGQRLIRLIEARQQWLGDEWIAITSRGETNYQAVYRVRNGQGSPTAKTKRGLEAGLYWPVGAIDEILAGRAGDELITLPRTHGQSTPERIDAALQRTYDRIVARRGKDAADQWVADTRHLAGDTERPNTASDTA